jgi:hypothetical protein
MEPWVVAVFVKPFAALAAIDFVAWLHKQAGRLPDPWGKLLTRRF